MRVSREEKDAGHERIVAEASRLLRRRGVEATGVAEVMTAAGRTHGGFYRHFANKQALVAAAVDAAFEDVLKRLDSTPAAAYAVFYLSEAHLRHPEQGCPIAAVGGDFARQPAALRRGFGAGLRRVVARLADGMTGSAARRQRAATRRLAMLVGAMVMARFWATASYWEVMCISLIMTDGIYAGDGLHSHPDEPPSQRPLTASGTVILEDNVHVGEYVTILKNVRIGTGSIIGAHSNVTRDIPPYSIAAGNPARPLKRFCHATLRWVTLDETR